MEVQGRHRYYRLANPAVATVIEDLAQLSGRPAIFNLPKLSPSALALRQARTCYDPSGRRVSRHDHCHP